MPGGLDGVLQLLAWSCRQCFNVADRPQTDAVLDEHFRLAAQEMLEQPHERRNFVRRALQIFSRKGVERQVADAQLARRVNDGAHRLHTPAMTLDAREPALLRPAAVAVHDDGDMVGNIGAGRLHAWTPALYEAAPSFDKGNDRSIVPYGNTPDADGGSAGPRDAAGLEP